MKREDFERGVSDYTLAQESSTLAMLQDAQAPAQPPEGEEAPAFGVDEKQPSVQVAGLGTSVARAILGREAGDLVSKSSRELVKNKPERPDQAANIEQVGQELQKFSEFRAEQQNLNSLSQVETPDELGQLIEKAGTTDVPKEGRTFDELESRTDTVGKVMDELKPIIEGRQGGPLSDVQVVGVARIVSTAFDDVANLTKMVNEGDETPEVLLRLWNAKATYEVMNSFARGNATETARALNAQKVVAQALDAKDFAAYERILSGEEGTKFTKTIKQWSKIIAEKTEKMGTVGKAMNWAVAHLNDASRIAVEYWKNNMLSGLGTHVVNNTSIALYNMYENMAIRPVAAGIGTIRAGAGAGKDKVYSSEVFGSLISKYAGVRGSWGMFYDSLVSNQSAFNVKEKAETSNALDKAFGQSGIGKAANIATTGSFRVLSATDDAWRGLSFTEELYALSARQASKEGLKGKAFIQRMNELIENPSPEVYEAAATKAAQMTFTDVEEKGTIAHMSKAVRVLVGEVPALQFVIPFVNTPSRLLHVATEMSALAPFSKRLRDDLMAGGAKADIAAAKMTMGITTTTMLWQMYEAGLITGGGPDDFRAQEMMKKEGWQPWAVNFNGKMYGTERMDPLGQATKIAESLGVVAGYFDKAKYAATDEEKEKNWASAALYLSQYMLDTTWMQSTKDFMDVLEGRQSMEKYSARTLAGFVPYHAGIKSLKEIREPRKPAVKNDKYVSDILSMASKYAQGNFPTVEAMGIGAAYVRPRRYWDGTVIMPEQGGFAATAFPWGPTTLKAEDSANKALFENGVVPREPSSVVKIGPKEFSLLQLDSGELLYDFYIKAIGEARRENIQKIMDKSKYKSAAGGPGSMRSIALRKGINVANKQGLKQFLDSLSILVDSDEGFYSELASQLGSDPKALIKQATMEVDHELKGIVIGRPTRQEFEYTIPEMK